MATPRELSLEEIRDFMLVNGGKVTNHALVKHFKRFLTDPRTQNEARKNFKTFVNILATSRNEGNDKFLILRKRYYNECPTEDNLSLMSQPMSPMSPGSRSGILESEDSPVRIPPPYRPPPEVHSIHVLPIGVKESESAVQFKGCVDEFKTALTALKIENRSRDSLDSQDKIIKNLESPKTPDIPLVPPRKRNSVEKTLTREFSIDITMNENLPSPSLSSEEIKSVLETRGDGEKFDSKISVKEATKKFNRIASEEEAKIITSPPGKIKKPEKDTENKENLTSNENLISHPKAKEWLVNMAGAKYQELAKLAKDHPQLTRLQDPATGYTALHWAAKHGNADVVKLIAGTHGCNVNEQTNGGYTPLHIAIQFERDHIFELLCNVYRADRDICDWSGKKPLDYRRQKTSVAPSTFNKIKARKKQSEKDLGFLRIGSLNVRVKKTTEAFSNFLGVGGNNTNCNNSLNRVPLNIRTSAPPNSSYFEKIHKNWGSADNIPHNNKMTSTMPPPKYGGSAKKHRSKRAVGDFGSSNQMHSHSMPNTPNQARASIVSENPQPNSTQDSDSDSAYGFDSNWSGTTIGGPQKKSTSTYI